MESFVRLTIGSIIQEEIQSAKEKETMKIRLSQLRQIIRETIEETMEMEEADKDLNKDGEHDFEDVMIARMKASALGDFEDDAITDFSRGIDRSLLEVIVGNISPDDL